VVDATVVIKTDTEERRVAVFKDNKLRLLMTLVGFTRIGADNDSDASWLVPPSLTSADLQAAIGLIRKYEFDPLTYEDGKGPEDMLRSKTATERRAAPRVEFDDDSDGIDGDKEDRGEYAVDGPTARKPAGIRKKLTRRRERTPVELNDEEQDARAEARRTKEAEKQRKIKSTMFVHDSDDDDWDVDKEKEFYERENEIREFTMAQFKKSMGLTVDESISSKKTKKRKADGEDKKRKKRRKTPPRKKDAFDDNGDEEDGTSGASGLDEQPKTDKRKAPPKRRAGPFDASDSGDEDVHGEGSDADSEARKVVNIDSEEEDEATDTRLSSQHAAATRASDGESRLKTTSETTAMKQDVVMMDDEDEDEDGDEDEAEDDGPVTRRPAARTRAGFVIESDSDE
jgi:replication fork protection complex subunit Tof1/Swi1